MLAYDWNFLGLSTETKPTAGEKVVDGSTFYECDTSTFFIYYQGEWYQQTFVTEDGINFWVYKTLMKKMFGKLFDSNITKSKIIKPTTGTEIEFTNSLPAQITDLTGYGDTSQQTYSGNNLFNYQDQRTVSASFTTDSNGYITCTYDNSDGESSSSQYYFTNNLTLSASTEYAIFLEVVSVSGNGTLYVCSGTNSECQFTNNWSLEFSSLSSGDVKKYIDQTKSDLSGTTAGLRSYIAFGAGQSGSITFRLSVLADTSVTPETFVYQPYVGGIASPNPDYPQNVNVVTGEQTVTVSDGGGNTQTYTIDLGSTELCKLGNYQDYIYKSGDDWYVHKETLKYVYSDSSQTVYFDSSIPRTSFYRPTGILTSVSYCNQLTSGDSATTNNVYNIAAERIFLRANEKMTSAADWNTWMGQNPLNFYFALATPTDTKITDNTLIGQLNSLLNYIFPAGDHQIVITADGLPMALKLTITEKE